MTEYAHYYAYAPISGNITALDTYCGESTNHPHNWNTVSPIDIGGTGTLVFAASSNVKSIKIGYWSLCSGYDSPWSDGVYVELYEDVVGTQPGGYIGAVYYGHVANRASAGSQNYSGGTVTIGSATASCPHDSCSNACCSGGDCWCTPASECNCCYQGGHSHFELKNDSPVSSANSGLYCGKPMYAGDSSSWVYKWDVPL